MGMPKIYLAYNKLLPKDSNLTVHSLSIDKEFLEPYAG